MGQNIVIMATNSLKIQRFRANDLVDNGGKQFELGSVCCFPQKWQVVVYVVSETSMVLPQHLHTCCIV